MRLLKVVNKLESCISVPLEEEVSSFINTFVRQHMLVALFESSGSSIENRMSWIADTQSRLSQDIASDCCSSMVEADQTYLDGADARRFADVACHIPAENETDRCCIAT